MQQLRFTTRILGRWAVSNLKAHQITQTLRGYDSNMVQSVLSGRLKVGDQIGVTLNNQQVGLAEYIIMDYVRWLDLDHDDAVRGGFDNLEYLEKALHRAGYRFRSIDKYKFYRIQFSWLDEAP